MSITDDRPPEGGVYGADLRTMLSVAAHLLYWSTGLRTAERPEEGEERAYRLHAAAAADRCLQLAPTDAQFLRDAAERAAELVAWDHRSRPWTGGSERVYVRWQYGMWMEQHPHSDPLRPGLDWGSL